MLRLASAPKVHRQLPKVSYVQIVKCAYIIALFHFVGSPNKLLSKPVDLANV